MCRPLPYVYWPLFWWPLWLAGAATATAARLSVPIGCRRLHNSEPTLISLHVQTLKLNPNAQRRRKPSATDWLNRSRG